MAIHYHQFDFLFCSKSDMNKYCFINNYQLWTNLLNMKYTWQFVLDKVMPGFRNY